MKIVRPEQMREIDRLAIEELGIPSVVLMDNAGRAVADEISRRAERNGLVVAVLCGPGNNGGDGMAAARYLHDRGNEVTVFLASKRSSYTGDARVMLGICRRMGVPLVGLESESSRARAQREVQEADVVVDALFGTGLGREVTGLFAECLEMIASCQGLVVSVDIPSGLDGLTGRILGRAVPADVTVTLAWPKVGLMVYPGADFVGELVLADIGIPRYLSDKAGVHGHLLEPNVLRGAFAPRWENTHKGSYGHLLVCAGSVGKSGAGILCARAALRTGAGLVSLALPLSSVTAVNAACPEAMNAPLPETPDGTLSIKGKNALLRLAGQMSALAIGPGLTVQEETAELVRAVLSSGTFPAVVDADALNALEGDLALLSKRGGGCVLTPHPGEMARLMGTTVEKVQADRVGTAIACSARSGCVTVLKGARTVVASPDGQFFINPTGNAGMATAGTGDVLTGMIGALLAMGRDPLISALAAVYLHGAAGDEAAEKQGGESMTAGDLVELIGPTLKNLLLES